jgi:transposase
MSMPTQEEFHRISPNLRSRSIECVINEGGELRAIADGLIGYGAELWKKLHGSKGTARALYLLALKAAPARWTLRKCRRSSVAEAVARQIAPPDGPQ